MIEPSAETINHFLSRTWPGLVLVALGLGALVAGALTGEFQETVAKGASL